MTIIFALAIALATQSPGNPELCAGAENKIAEDMRILESDLSQAAANEAAEKLQSMVARGQVTGEFMFGALNQAKILHGHILLRQAHSDREEFGPQSIEFKEAKSALCYWLVTEGFWYD